METFFNLIAYPAETIYNISRKDTGYRSFLILALANVSLISGLAFFFGSSARMLLFSLTWGLAMRLIFMAFCIFFIASLYHYFAEIFGGYGSGSSLFKALPYSFAPYCFVAPVTLILKAFAGEAAVIFLILVFVVMLFWVAFLQYKIINYFYGLSVNNAITVLIMPWIIIAGFAAMVPVVLVSGILKFLL